MHGEGVGHDELELGFGDVVVDVAATHRGIKMIVVDDGD